MSYVNAEGIVDHLSTEMRRALRDAVQQTIPTAQFDEHELFRAFRRAVRRKCSDWESVPNQYVRE